MPQFSSPEKLIFISIMKPVDCSVALRWQGYYLEVKFPVEKAPTRIIATVGSGVNVAELLEYPVRGLVFEGGKNMLDLSDTVSSACIFLQESNRPFNVLFSECGKRIFLLLQVMLPK